MYLLIVFTDYTIFLFLQYFRQDYCRYERDFLDNLEHSHDIESCQWACQVNPECNFFTFSTDENVCMLHRVDVRTRVCDIIHGPPTPTLQSCLDDGAIPWAASSSKILLFLSKKLTITFFNTNGSIIYYNTYFQMSIGLAEFMPTTADTPMPTTPEISKLHFSMSPLLGIW